MMHKVSTISHNTNEALTNADPKQLLASVLQDVLSTDVDVVGVLGPQKNVAKLVGALKANTSNEMKPPPAKHDHDSKPVAGSVANNTAIKGKTVSRTWQRQREASQGQRKLKCTRGCIKSV